MMSREPRPQAAIGVIVGWVIGLITLVGGAEWVLSSTYSTFAAAQAADERDLRLLRVEVEEMKLDRTKRDADMTATNQQISKQLDILQATWDMLKDQERFQSRPRR